MITRKSSLPAIRKMTVRMVEIRMKPRARRMQLAEKKSQSRHRNQIQSPFAMTLISRAARLVGEHFCRLRRCLRFGYAETVRLEIHVYPFLRAPILFAEFSGSSFTPGRGDQCRWMRP